MASKRRVRNAPARLDALYRALDPRRPETIDAELDRIIADRIAADREHIDAAVTARRWCGCLAIDCGFCLERAARPWASVTGGAR